MAKVFTITEGLENMGALSTGGQGSVYKGKRIGTVISAVKLLPTPIHTEDAFDKNFRDFQNEVEKLKKVNEDPNPHVVRILNSGLTESGNFPFIEMEFIEGPDLEELLKAPHPPLFTISETIKLANHLASALSHCHKVGVKHGDIKSNNVKFNQATGNYVLLDFGLAVMSDEQRRSSLRHAGAVEFMAPEQHHGEMRFETDLYSFGIILYELLAGTVPFPLINKSEMSRNMVMLSHVEKQVPDLLELRKNRLPEQWPDNKKADEMRVPSWLMQIIYKCLEKAPEDRFANGMELYEALSNHNDGLLNKEEVDRLISGLKSENERLQRTLAKYKQVTKSKAILISALLCFVFLGVYGINSVFNTRDSGNVIAADSTVTTKVPVKSNAKRTPDTIKKTAPVNNNPVAPQNKKTKDGLENDVPYF
ncbi:serine/threonine-protein kinase [Pedobacter metabolipauper]|uniref:Serine/threonine-protein kinase n=1 Tax=Pedobacter metabolipauper TaxID=425513 RepID=A0A4R6SR07_9SPHI|nr:serine/threonine-protein kinase [Pedobacter metabolipauper]TDQ07362.1 serine/threonine-protein kinase [Pedobacter metabolipauper]